MRKINMFILPVAAALIFSLVNGAAEEKNIFQNGDMEKWITVKDDGKIPSVKYGSGCIPEGFYGLTPDPGVEEPDQIIIDSDNKEKHGGSTSARITIKSPKIKAGFAMMQIPCEPETRYKIRLWLKGDLTIQGSHKALVVWVHFGPRKTYWASKDRHAFTVDFSRGTFDWQEFETTVNTVADTEEIRVIVKSNEKVTGDYWVDDIEIIPMGKSEALNSF